MRLYVYINKILSPTVVRFSYAFFCLRAVNSFISKIFPATLLIHKSDHTDTTAVNSRILGMGIAVHEIVMKVEFHSEIFKYNFMGTYSNISHQMRCINKDCHNK